MSAPKGRAARAAKAAPVYRGVEEIPAELGPAVAAIGNFDGVHLGHQDILAGAVAEARELGARAVVVTFDPHPEQVLRPVTAPQLITPAEVRLRLLAETGVDAVVVLRFDEALAALEARDFVRRIMVGALNVRSVHEGRSFRFGHGARAGMKELAGFGKEFGFTVRAHEAVRVHGMEVSSSAIRTLVAAGDVRRARWMLGRPFAVHSTPAKGRGLGTRLLVPTVNLAPYGALLPSFGVYATRLQLDGRLFRAVTNVGNRPTFGEASFAVESHILDFEPVNLNELTPLKLEFLLRLRGERTWPSPQALKAQITADVARAKRYFRMK